MGLKRSSFVRKLAFGLGCVLLLNACNLPFGRDASEEAEAVAEDATGVLTVAMEPAFPPFEFLTDSGELAGFDVDLMRAIGEKSGLDIKFESLPFDGIIPALRAGSVDAAISGMTIAEERAEVVDFSRPYIEVGLAIAVQTSNTDIQSLEDLEGKKIGVTIGTTGADQAAEIPGAEISTYQAVPDALRELANGSVDAVINDAPVTLEAIALENIAGVKVVGDLLTTEYYGIAVPKESENLEIINKALTELMKDGTYAEIYKKWFGTEPPSLPESVL